MSDGVHGSSSYAGLSFYLIPENSAAKRVVRHDHNAPYLADKNGEEALHIDFTDPETRLPKNRVQLGRDSNHCDIVIPESNTTTAANIHRKHCYFECHPTTGAVVLVDQSANRGTVVDDEEEDCVVPISRAESSVVITRGFNRNLHFGKRAYYKFQVVWSAGSDPLRSFLSKRPNNFGPTDFDPTKARYLEGDILGSGAFGFVRRAVNIRNGTPMAVKRFHSLEGRRHVMAMREVNNMLKISSNNRKTHDNILQILDVVYDKEEYKWIEIFMPLMDGSVKAMIDEPHKLPFTVTETSIGNQVLYQMAEALKYMARYDIVHRDVKPENILYQPIYNAAGDFYTYRFRLADFGLSSDSVMACTVAGTPLFMAPEVIRRQPQSPKTDIWSLFVTVAWILNLYDFRDFVADDPDELFGKIKEMAEHEAVANIRDMAIIDPEFRISARSLVSRLKEGGMQSIDEVGQNMADMHLWQYEDAFLPSVTEDVRNRFQAANGGLGREHQWATMNGQSAMGEFFTTEADPSYVEQQNPAAKLGQDYDKPRRVRESQDYKEVGDVNDAKEEEEEVDDGGYASTYHYVQ